MHNSTCKSILCINTRIPSICLFNSVFPTDIVMFFVFMGFSMKSPYESFFLCMYININLYEFSIRTRTFFSYRFPYVCCFCSKLNHSLNVHLNSGLFSETFLRVFKLKHNLYGAEFMYFIIVKHLADCKIYARV